MTSLKRATVALVAGTLLAVGAVGTPPASAARTVFCGSYAPGSKLWPSQRNRFTIRWVTARDTSCSSARRIVGLATRGEISPGEKNTFMAAGDWFCRVRDTGDEAATTTCEAGASSVVRWRSAA